MIGLVVCFHMPFLPTRTLQQKNAPKTSNMATERPDGTTSKLLTNCVCVFLLVSWDMWFKNASLNPSLHGQPKQTLHQYQAANRSCEDEVARESVHVQDVNKTRLSRR